MAAQNICGRDSPRCDRQAVERNVPNQFVPMFLHQVLDYSALHSTLTELPGEIVRPLFGHANQFAEVEVSVIEMLNQTGRNALETNEAQPAHHPFGAEMLGEKFLVTQPVLQGKQDGASMQQRRN